jgi:N-acetylmuramoyl-L-alanine amidase
MALFGQGALALHALLVFIVATPVAAQPLVVLDPGHGGTDPGAVGCSLEEADVVLDTAQRLEMLLSDSGVRVAMTRDGDTHVDLSARASFANARGATGFFSVHSNSNAGTPATGTETFVMTGAGAPSRALGRAVQDAMVAAWGLRDRGLKEANFAVLRLTTMPAALGELAFTNNCSVDAMLLRDPAARQQMAVALHDAILGWLGVSPEARTGTLRGVVFEDQGVGTEDLTVRIPGARVTIVETDASATAAAGDAAWSFTLPAGRYTVRAEASGYDAATRRCDVAAGATTWCSVGLVRAGADAGTGGADDGGTPADAGDADGGPPFDASDGDLGDAGGVTAAPPPSLRNEGACGCRVATAHTVFEEGHGAYRGAVLALVWMALFSRRARARRRARMPSYPSRRRLLQVASVVAGATALTLWGCSPREPEAPPPTGQRAAVREPASAPGATAEPSRSPADGAPAAAPTAPPRVAFGARRQWLVGALGLPLLSPDGRHVALATPDADALFVLSLDTGDATPRELCRGGRCGWEPRWQAPASSDGTLSIAHRIEGQSGTAVPGAAIALDGRPVPVTAREPGVHVWTDDEDQAWLRLGGVTRRVGPRGERVMMPTLTADHRHVVLWSLTGGVLVVEVNGGQLRRLGAGGHPRVDPSGRWLVYERTRDDGHRITASELWVADLHAPGSPPARLDDPRDAHASPLPLRRMPSLSQVDDAGRARLAWIDVYPEGHALTVTEITLGY